MGPVCACSRERYFFTLLPPPLVQAIFSGTAYVQAHHTSLLSVLSNVAPSFLNITPLSSARLIDLLRFFTSRRRLLRSENMAAAVV